MTRSDTVPPDRIRAQFSAAMSAMYRAEVPAYGTLMALVDRAACEAMQAALAAARAPGGTVHDDRGAGTPSA